MKTTLLLSLFLSFSIGFSQNEISNFNGNVTDSPVFLTLESTNPINHTVGANQIWTFSGLSSLGNTSYNYSLPTPSEIITYPGTTNIMVTTFNPTNDVSTTAKLYTKIEPNNTFSITGLVSDEFTLNLSTNNATVGTFPMVYGYSNSDSNVAGNYVYDTYSGNMTGNITTTVDAYGQLNLPDYNATPYQVTRMKTVLFLSLNYSIFNNAGTITQTTYNYYSSLDTTTPIFRSTTTSLVSSLLSINETRTSLEGFQALLLNQEKFNQNSIWIKNPIANSIEINSSYTIENANIKITDMLGKSIYESKNNIINGTVEIPISLNKGVYLINISNEKGNITKKIIKG
jgi:hypothetical protein